MENIYMKKKYSFTLDEELIDWFKRYCKEEYTNMSCTINQYILELKRNITDDNVMENIKPNSII